MIYESLIYDDNDNLFAFKYKDKRSGVTRVLLIENFYLRFKDRGLTSNGDLYFIEKGNRIEWNSKSCDFNTLPKYSFENDFYKINKDGVLLSLSDLGKEYVRLGCTKIIVPYFVNGIMVKELGESCFNGEEFTEIVLPNCLKKICKNAFAYSSIEAIKIPDSCIEIDETAFIECYDLEYLDLGKGVQRIGLGSFYDCRGFGDTEIFIPNSVKEIGEDAFGCIEDVDFVVDNSPNSITMISKGVDMTEFDEYEDYDEDEDFEEEYDEDDPYYQECFFGAYNVNVKYLRN